MKRLPLFIVRLVVVVNKSLPGDSCRLLLSFCGRMRGWLGPFIKSFFMSKPTTVEVDFALWIVGVMT